MFHHLGRFTTSHPWLICAAWVLLGVVLSAVAPSWDARAQDDNIRFLPDRCPSVRGYRLIEKAFPQDVCDSRLIFAVERDGSPLTTVDFAFVDSLVEELENLRKQEPALKIGAIHSHRDGLIGSRLTSSDSQCTLIQISLRTPFLALQTQATVDRAHKLLQEKVEAAGPEALLVYCTGSAGMGRDLVRACGDSLDATSVATVILVVVVLLLVYRAPLLALVPLLTIGVSVWVSLKILALLTLLPGVHLVNISKIFCIVILYGAGTDYCLFLISRYREELESGRDVGGAIAQSVGKVGGALTASAGTVMCGLGLMGLAEFAKVRYAGPGIALSLGVALLASLTLTPALLRLAGRVVFWPAKGPVVQPVMLLPQWQPKPPGLWQWISRKVVRHPVLIWCVAVALLLPLALLGFQVTPDYRATSQLAPSSDSLRGLTALKKHFTAGETGPITVLLNSPNDWDTRAGRIEIDHFCRFVKRLPNVAEIRSLTQPLGKALPEPDPAPASMGALGRLLQSVRPTFLDGFLEEARRAAREHYLSVLPPESPGGGKRYVTRLDLILKTDPFDAASGETVKLIQTWLRMELPHSTFLNEGLLAECYGVTVNTQDLETVTESDRRRVNTLITAGIFLILLVLVRRPLLAAYLLATVLFSYYATLGATMLAGVLWTGAPLQQLDWRVLFFLFTILVAVGEDYNILLVTRALQEQVRHGPIEGMRRALARTGGTITSCGLIMAGTFATLMLSNLGTLLQIGFALSFGVLLDTFVVRPFLVPCFVVMTAGQPVPADDRHTPLVKPRKPVRLAG